MRRVPVPERRNWKDVADASGFRFHHTQGETYWDESACFVFTLEEIERDIEEPSRILHALCLDLAEAASHDERLMERLGVPPPFRDHVANSWRGREPTVLGRFDLAYDGRGPAKLLEYNADTPTGLYEAAFFQWTWLEQSKELGTAPPDADQFNSIHEKLVEAYGGLSKDSILHFTTDETSVEDHGTILYMMDCASQAGHRVAFIDIRDIGHDGADRFTDLNGSVIDVLGKIYPWEWLFVEQFGPKIPRSGTRFIEPAWKAMLSTKAILPLLWERHPGHPNLLPAFFEGDARAGGLDNFVRKPLFSREGANISLHRAGAEVESNPGPYGEQRAWVVQETAGLFRSQSGYAVLGSWIVGGEACGLGMREDASAITKNLSRFVPHMIADDSWRPGRASEDAGG